MKSKEEVFSAWKNNTRPSDVSQIEYNGVLRINFYEIHQSIVGDVEWSDELDSYVFVFKQHENPKGDPPLLHENVAHYDPDTYLHIRSILRKDFGIFVTRNIFDSSEATKREHSVSPVAVHCN